MAERINFHQQHLAQRVKQTDMAWLVLDNECNWRCRHCYFDEHSKSRPVQEALAITRQLTTRGIHVIPAAGEVLLKPDYLAVYTAANAKHLLSNGLILASKEGGKIAQKLVDSGIEQIGFTLNRDGSYDFLHGVSPEVVARAVATVKKAGLVPTATSVITSQNFDRVGELCSLAQEVGVKAIRFNRLIPTRPDLLPLTPTPEQTIVFFDELYEQRRIWGPDFGIYASGLFGLRGRRKELPLKTDYCFAGSQIVAIDVDNSVYPCLLLMAPEYKLGQLDPTSGSLPTTSRFSSTVGRDECSAYQLLYKNQK